MCSRQAPGAGLALGLLLAVSGCGKQGNPLPPLRPVPAAARDLAARQVGSELVLELAYPKTTAAGLVLPGLEAVEVWEATRPAPPPGVAAPPVEPREFEGQARLLATLRGAELQTAVAGDRLRLRLPLAETQQARTLGVRLVGPGGERSAASNLATLVPQAPPAPPGGLEVAARAEGVEISWSEAPGATGYRVYRRDPRQRSWGAPLTTAGAAERRFLDTGARFGERYVYTLTAVAAPLVESAAAGEREIEYLDRFGPPPPPGLVALPEEGRVRLSWEPSPAADVAGYLVWRRPEGSEEEFQRLTSAPFAGLEYVDERLAAGARFRYRVSAQDRAGNLGQPSAEVSAAVR
jgi:hypothetical protein